MRNLRERELYGVASIEPDEEVIAGRHTSFQLIYIIGSTGISTGGHIRIYTDSDTDWELPQFNDPAGADYMTIHSPTRARVSALVRDVKTIVLEVNGRSLEPGEKVILTYGDRNGGGPGTRVQTFIERKHYFWVSIDAEADDNYITLRDSPYLRIVGDRPKRLIVVAPSLVTSAQLFRLSIKAEDEWGNPSQSYVGSVKVQGEGVSLPFSEIRFGPEHEGVYPLDGCKCTGEGRFKIIAVDQENDIMGKSNPILCSEGPIKHHLYWGDPHGGQVELAAKIPDFFQYALDISRIDFTGYQRNDHDISPEDWRLQQEAEEEFYQPGRFVPLPGFEWSGLTDRGGHHNVYFRRHQQPIRRSDHSGIADKSGIDNDLPHINDVYKAYRYKDVVITPHVGGYPGDLTFHEPTLEPAIEVTSTHGTFEWFLEDALSRGYEVGFVGGSDGYTGRPGGEYPGHLERRFAKGGLTGLYAEDLSLESILEALKARRCYATTGERIITKLSADDHLMGKKYFSRSVPRISGFVHGIAPLETVEIFRGLEKIYSHPIPLSSTPNRIRLLWDGASTKASYTGVNWNGELSVRNAKITDTEAVRFDSPRSRIYETTETDLKWTAISCGYPCGIIFSLDSERMAEFQVILNISLIRAPNYGGFGNQPPLKMSYGPAERLTFGFSIDDLAKGPKEIPIGSLNRKVTVSLAPATGSPETVEFTYRDPSPKPGINPYWMRVKQTNMEMAWTSPVFLDYARS
jgi:hypothetical protein